MSNQNQPNNNVQNQKQVQAQQVVQPQQPQIDMVEIISRQQAIIEGLSADRDALMKNAGDLASVIKELKTELSEVKASLKEEKIRQQLQAEAEQKAMALVETFKTSLEAGGVGVPTVNGGANNNGSYDRLHYLFKFGDKRRRGIF